MLGVCWQIDKKGYVDVLA